MRPSRKTNFFIVYILRIHVIVVVGIQHKHMCRPSIFNVEYGQEGYCNFHNGDVIQIALSPCWCDARLYLNKLA
ncbi:hypothetical protein ABKN59_010414 [Abortiporus biennis]